MSPFLNKQLLNILFLFCTTSTFAATVNGLFGDHMVLQRGIDIPVWGSGRNGEKVHVFLNGQKASTVVIGEEWNVILPAMNAGGPYCMKVTGDSTFTINDIYIGEVWVCSGQSNMGRTMSPHRKYQTITNFEQEKAEANHPLIRQYKVPEMLSDIPMGNTRGNWAVCTPSTVESFSAVGYFFARDLYKSLNVPIGIIEASIGGTQAMHWTSRAALKSNPKLLPLVEEYLSAVNSYPERLAEYQTNEDAILADYEKSKQRAALENKPLPKRPKPPNDPSNRRRISCYYNGMIAPLTKYPIKGVCWYQGESDRDLAAQYLELFPTLITDWRTNWHLGDFPFLFVQIAPFVENTPEIREAQLLTLQNTVNTSMVVTTDCGDPNDIHPPYKQPVGYRLSLAARALAYGESIPYSGPVYDSFSIKGDSIEISFQHIDSGLMCQGEKLQGFTISRDDKDFVNAQAIIRGEKVIVYNDSIDSPTTVRYGWANIPNGNLYNMEALPASPFRTDHPVIR